MNVKLTEQGKKKIIELISQYLCPAVANGEDMKERENMAYA